MWKLRSPLGYRRVTRDCNRKRVKIFMRIQLSRQCSTWILARLCWKVQCIQRFLPWFAFSKIQDKFYVEASQKISKPKSRTNTSVRLCCLLSSYLFQQICNGRRESWVENCAKMFKVFVLQLVIWAPVGSPLKSKETSMNFPNRDELSLDRVLAFPNDSRIILDCRIWNLVKWNSRGCPVIAARYCSDNFMASVLPEPDSPVKIRHWSEFMSFIDRQARSVTA